MNTANLQHEKSSAEWNEGLTVFRQWQDFRRNRAHRWQGLVHQLESHLQASRTQAEKLERVAGLSNRIAALTQHIDHLAIHLMQNPALGAELAVLFKDLQAAQQELEEARKFPIYRTLTLPEEVGPEDLQDLLFLLTGQVDEMPMVEPTASAWRVEDPLETDPQEEVPVNQVPAEEQISEGASEIPPAAADVETEPHPAVPEPELGHTALKTPSLQKEAQRLLEALLPQPREELVSLVPRTADHWERMDTHFKLRTLLNKLRMEQPGEDSTANLTRWIASFRHREVQVLELVDPDLDGEKDLAWMVIAAFLHTVHRWELPVGKEKYRVFFKHPRTCERIEQMLKQASTPLSLTEIHGLLMLDETQLSAALPLLPFAEMLPDGRFQHRKRAVVPETSPLLARVQRDENWNLILEVLDPRWHALAETLANTGLPAPEDCHVDLQDLVQVTGHQALLLWTAAKVAVVESGEVVFRGHQTFPVNLPDLARQLRRALAGR